MTHQLGGDADELNARHALDGILSFRRAAGGLLFADITNAQAQASLCLQGAQLLHWQPQTSAPVVWLSSGARYEAGKAIRGGIPVCWPWFGPNAQDRRLPNHGFVRTRDWGVRAARADADGATRLVLELSDSADTLALWPYAFSLSLQLRVGSTLELDLTSTNTGTRPMPLSEALHSYFAVGDVARTQVLGLDGCTYHDTAHGGARQRQGGAVHFAGELDRVYLDTPGNCTIVDAVLGRRIRIAKSGSRSTVVWNPGAQRAAQMDDLGSGRLADGTFADGQGWRNLVCLESGNALDDALELAPGASHRLSVRYEVQEPPATSGPLGT